MGSHALQGQKPVPRMSLAQAILAGEPRAAGQYADILRASGKKYAEVVAAIQAVYARVGRVVPDAAEVDAMLYASDEGGARGP